MCQCCSVCSRIIIVIIGIITVPLGLVLIGAGITLFAHVEIVNSFFRSFLESQGITSCFRFSTIEVESAELMTAAAGLFLGLGLFWFLTGCCGCLGGCCTLEWSLVTYLVVYGLCEIAGIVFIILEYTQKGEGTAGCFEFTRAALFSPGVLGVLVGLPLLGGLLIFMASWVLAYKCKFGKENTVHPI